MVISTILSVPLSASTTPADVVRCNKDISKATQKLSGSYEARLKRCFSRGQSFCPPFDLGVDKARNKMIAKIGNPNGSCAAAVAGGLSLDELGPGLECTDMVQSNGCGTNNGQLENVNDLALCLNCAMDAVNGRLQQKVAADLEYTFNANEAKCLRSMFIATIKIARKGRKEVAKCAKDGAQPFACPVPDDPESKVGKALAKLGTRVAKCSDGGGVPGVVASAVMERLCPDRASQDNADFELCFAGVAKCAACLYSNLAFGQSQNCSEFAGTGCHETSVFAGMAYVVNQDDDTVTYYNADGSLLDMDVASSSFPVGSVPSDVAVNPHDGIIYVTNSADGTVTYLDARSGAPYLGSPAASTFATGNNPVAVTYTQSIDRHERTVFVLNQGDQTVTLLHGRSGEPIHGDLPSSTFPVGNGPTDVYAFPQALGKAAVAVTNYDDDTVTTFSRDDRDYSFGDLASSTFAVGDGPLSISPFGVMNKLDDTLSTISSSGTVSSTVALLPGAHRVVQNEYSFPPESNFFVDNPSTWALTDTGDMVFLRSLAHQTAGTLAQSTFSLGNGAIDLATDAFPSSPEAARYFVLLQGDEEVASFHPDITAGSQLGVPGCLIAGLQVDAGTELAYLLCKSGEVVVLDATNPAFALGTQAASTFQLPVYDVVTDLALDPISGNLYVASYRGAPHDEFGVTYADSATLTPSVGSPYSAGPIVGAAIPAVATPVNVAVNGTAGLAYEADLLAGGMVYLDNLIGSYVGGNKVAATLSLGTQPHAMVSSEASALTYVVDLEDDTITYVDATSVDYAGIDYASSTLATGGRPIEIAVNDSADRVYVANSDDATVTYFSSAAPGYAMGTLGASTIAVEDVLSVAATPAANLVYAGNDRLVLLDATTGAYINGTLEDSDYPTRNARLMGVNSTSQILLVATGSSLTYHDASTGLYLNWSPTVSTAATGSNPVAIEVMP